jgi:uncharacterized protein
LDASALRQLSAGELEPLATGAWILGAGGGGNPYSAWLNLRKLYRDGRRVQLADPLGLADDDLVAVVSIMGSPLVMQERLLDPALAAKPVRMMEQFIGHRFDAVMAVEIGGSNALQPMLAAALLNLPVVDADAMGRAFPEAQMTSFAIHDLPMFPLTLADIRDNEVVVARAASWKWMERLSRKVTTEVGSIAFTCKAPRTGREVKQCAILGSVSKAIRIGRIVFEARRVHADPVAALLQAERGMLLFKGKITEVTRRTTEGFLRGSARLDGLDEFCDRKAKLFFQNEFSVGLIDGHPCAMTPDIICAIDTDSGEAIGTESLRYGQRVTIIALPAPAVLLSPKGLELVGPRAFGYDLEFRSVFENGTA